jgi:hypothetical protein
VCALKAAQVLVPLTNESGHGGFERIVLLFKLDLSPALEDIRISILPLVMETSLILGYKEVTVRVQCETHFKKTSFSLQTLRTNVTIALENSLLLYKETAVPDIWINGSCRDT